MYLIFYLTELNIREYSNSFDLFKISPIRVRILARRIKPPFTTLIIATWQCWEDLLLFRFLLSITLCDQIVGYLVLVLKITYYFEILLKLSCTMRRRKSSILANSTPETDSPGRLLFIVLWKAMWILVHLMCQCLRST